MRCPSVWPIVKSQEYERIKYVWRCHFSVGGGVVAHAPTHLLAPFALSFIATSRIESLSLQRPRALTCLTRLTMCGIHAAISADAGRHRLSPGLDRRLRNRGPDHLGVVEAQLCSLCLTLTSTVLSLRGDHLAKQPLVDAESGSVLCWNGEAWKLGGKPVEGNDGEAVLSLLTAASRNLGNEDSVLDALRSIEGPFAFIFLDKNARRLYYGRDRLGRRSLLLKWGDEFLLSSIAEAPAEGWAEVEADGCYTIQLDGANSPRELMSIRHDWAQNKDLVSCCLEALSQATRSKNMPTEIRATYDIRYQVLAFSTPLFLLLLPPRLH